MTATQHVKACRRVQCELLKFKLGIRKMKKQENDFEHDRVVGARQTSVSNSETTTY